MTLCLAMVSTSPESEGRIWVAADTLGTWQAGSWFVKDEDQQKIYPLGKRFLLLESGQESRTIKAWIRELQTSSFDTLTLDAAARLVKDVIDRRYQQDFGENHVSFALALCGHDPTGRPGIWEIRSRGPKFTTIGDVSDSGRIALGVEGPADHYFYCFWKKRLKWEALERLGKFIFSICCHSQWGVGGAIEIWSIMPDSGPKGPAFVPSDQIMNENRPIFQFVQDSIIGDGERPRC